MGRLALGGRPSERASQRPQRFVQQIGSIPAGNTNSVGIEQTDYLTGIDVIPALTFTAGATAPTGPSAAGAYAPFANVQVNAPGNQSPFSMPGYHAAQLYKCHDHGFTDAGLVANATPAANATATWASPIRIPFTVSPQTEIGAFFTGDTKLNMSVQIGWNPIAAVFGTPQTTAMGGSVVLNREFFSAPQPDEQDGWLNQISYMKSAKAFSTAVQLSNGDTTVTLDVDQDYVRILLVGYTGNYGAATFAPAAGILQTVTLELNSKFRIWDSVPEAELVFENYRAYQTLLPSGVLCLDFARLEPMNRRDILPTDPTVTKRLALKVHSGSSSNYLDVVTESVTDSQFAAGWIASAAAKQQQQTKVA